MIKKIIIILVVISSLLFIGGGILLTSKETDKKQNEVKEEVPNDNKEENKEEEIIIEDLSKLTEEQLKDADLMISSELLNLSKEIYINDNDIKYEDQNELFISIKAFKEKYNLDTNKISSTELVCDEEKTGIKFIKNDEKTLRIPILNCK